MTQFNKAQFSYHGGYLTYTMDDARTVKFVARFKYKGAISKAQFLKQLIKNHTVEEYFSKLEIDHVAPLVILKNADPQWHQAKLEEAMAFAEFKLETPEAMGADVSIRKMPFRVSWVETKEWK